MLPYIYTSLALFLTLAYGFIILRYLYAWGQQEEWLIPENFQAKTSISILIPARNEAKYIGNCIQSILVQNYPSDLFEILIIDDHSTDETVATVHNFKQDKVKVLSLKSYLANKNISTQSFKKLAIEYGISEAGGSIIVTTDADCTVPPNWLRSIAALHELKQKEFIAAPVVFHQERNPLERFQSLDFMGMMLITGASIQMEKMHLCNGANLAYTKRIFNMVNGFEGIDQVASGDDMLLMHKVARIAPEKIGFLKSLDAVVKTFAKPTLTTFLQQRLRWASKSSQYQDWELLVIQVTVFFFCCSILGSLLLSLFYGLSFLVLGTILFLSKTIIDYFFLQIASNYFHRRDLMNSFFSAQLMHIGYLIVVGCWSNFQKKYHWKGREIK